MAIEPFRQKIGIPDGSGVTQQGVGQIDSLGPTISKLGDEILQVTEPYAKQQAIKAGVAAAVAQPIAKDGQGNYIMPETPKGGIVYAAAFDKVSYDNYVQHVQNDTELRLNEVYSDPAGLTQTPAEKRAQGEAIIEGVLAGAAPQARGQLYESMSRELRQRDLAESNFHYRKQYELNVKTSTQTIETAEQKAGEALSWGDMVEAERQFAISGGAIDNLVLMGELPPTARRDMAERLISWRGYGNVKNDWRSKLNGLTAEENAGLADALEGNVPAGYSVMGWDPDKLRAEIPDPRVRNRLAADIRSKTQGLKEIEAKHEHDDDLNNFLSTIPIGGGVPDTVSDAQFEEGVIGWAGQTGIDYRTPDGMNETFARFGKLPAGLFKKVFDQSYAKTPLEVEKLNNLYNAMSKVIGRDGQTVNMVEGFLDPRDSAFMYHYNNARNYGGLAAQNAYEQAQAAVKKGLDIKPEQVMATLREQTGLTTKNGIDALGDKLDDYLPAKWGDMSTAARNGITLDAAQQIAMGVGWQKAFSNAGERFKHNWRRDTMSFESAASGGKGWVRNQDAVPLALDVKTGKQSNGWAGYAIQTGLNEYLGTQAVPGIPGIKGLHAGENVFARSTGRADDKGNQLFNLMYVDPKGGGMAVLLGKDGAPITLNLGRAAKGQQAWAQSMLDAYKKSRDNIAALNAQVMGIGPTEQIAAGIAFAIGGSVPPDMTNRGSNQKAAALVQAQKVHNEVFAHIEEAQTALTSVGLPRNRLQERQTSQATANTMGIWSPYTKEAIAPPKAQTDLIQYGKTANEWPDVARGVAAKFGLSPRDVAMVFGYESDFDPKKRGGNTGRRLGLIQMGEEELRTFGMKANGKPLTENSTATEWMNGIISYLETRGFKRGMTLLDLYSTINAGSPGKYEASDTAPGKPKMTVRSHVAKMKQTEGENADRWLGNR